MRQRRLLVSLLALAYAAPASASDASLVSIPSPRGATVGILLVKPKKPVAAAVLFAGGHGALGLTGPESMRWGAGNFLVRMRAKFADDGIAVAVVDAPSDQPQGMNAIFRMSPDHVSDAAAVVAYMRAQFGVPVWAIGTSMGTFSAAALAAGPVSPPDGLVLTSSITRSPPDWTIATSHPLGVASLPLAPVKVPVLIVSHQSDACHLTPPGDAQMLAGKLPGTASVVVEIVTGEVPAKSGPCDAFSPHGFYGSEDKTVSLITAFIKSNGPKP